MRWVPQPMSLFRYEPLCGLGSSGGRGGEGPGDAEALLEGLLGEDDGGQLEGVPGQDGLRGPQEGDGGRAPDRGDGRGTTSTLRLNPRKGLMGGGLAAGIGVFRWGGVQPQAVKKRCCLEKL